MLVTAASSMAVHPYRRGYSPRSTRQRGITISAGIAPNKFLAKIASDWKKPDGQFVIRPEQVQAFVATLPVKKATRRRKSHCS